VFVSETCFSSYLGAQGAFNHTAASPVCVCLCVCVCRVVSCCSCCVFVFRVNPTCETCFSSYLGAEDTLNPTAASPLLAPSRRSLMYMSEFRLRVSSF